MEATFVFINVSFAWNPLFCKMKHLIYELQYHFALPRGPFTIVETLILTKHAFFSTFTSKY